MSDRTVALIVTLDKDYRVDDAKSIIKAILMIKGVATVEPNIANMETYTAYSRARFDLEKKLFDALHEKTDKEK